MPPASGNTATFAQVQAVANQITALQTSVNTLINNVNTLNTNVDKLLASQSGLAMEVQALGQQGAQAVNALTVAVNNLAAKIP